VDGRITYLSVIVGIPRTPVPSSNPDISLPIRKSPDKLLKLREILRSTNANNLPIFHKNAVLQPIFRLLTGFLPCIIEILHESRIAFTSLWVADLLHDHVTAGSTDVAHVDEVVSAETVLGYFGLLADVAIVYGDDGAGSAVRSLDLGFGVRFYDDVLVVVPAVDLEALVVVGHVADEESVDSHCECFEKLKGLKDREYVKLNSRMRVLENGFEWVDVCTGSWSLTVHFIIFRCYTEGLLCRII